VAAEFDKKVAQAILAVLTQFDRPMTTSEISLEINKSRPITQRHLQILKRANRITKTKIGKRFKWAI